MEKLEKGREETDERASLLKELSEVEESVKNVDSELERFAEFDTDEMQKIKDSTVKVKEAVNRWVDNIFNCQSWAQKTFNMEKKDFDVQFGIPEELDYVE